MLKDLLFRRKKGFNLKVFSLVSVPERLTLVHSRIWSYWDKVWFFRNQAWLQKKLLKFFRN